MKRNPQLWNWLFCITLSFCLHILPPFRRFHISIFLTLFISLNSFFAASSLNGEQLILSDRTEIWYSYQTKSSLWDTERIILIIIKCNILGPGDHDFLPVSIDRESSAPRAIQWYSNSTDFIRQVSLQSWQVMSSSTYLWRQDQRILRSSGQGKSNKLNSFREPLV